jgi:hypothetical protein
MNEPKYIGLDVHQATISAAVLDSTGKLVMECVLETKAATILQFVHGLRGSVHVTLEEGTCAAGLLQCVLGRIIHCNGHTLRFHADIDSKQPITNGAVVRSILETSCVMRVSKISLASI